MQKILISTALICFGWMVYMQTRIYHNILSGENLAKVPNEAGMIIAVAFLGGIMLYVLGESNGEGFPMDVSSIAEARDYKVCAVKTFYYSNDVEVLVEVRCSDRIERRLFLKIKYDLPVVYVTPEGIEDETPHECFKVGAVFRFVKAKKNYRFEFKEPAAVPV